MPDELSVLLDDYNANSLREMAEANNMLTVDNDGKRLPKHQLLPKMRTEFFAAKRILASYQRLSQPERAVLNRLLLRGGRVSTSGFKREIIRSNLAEAAPEPPSRPGYQYSSEIPYGNGYIGSPARAGSNIFEDIMARLTYRGLVFSRGAEMSTGGSVYKLRFHPAAEVYTPQVIQDVLPTPTPAAETAPELQPAEAITADPALFLRDMYLYWDFVRRKEVELITNGLVGKRALKAINDTLLTADPLLDEARREDQTGRLYLLRQLLETLGLVRVEQNRLKSTIKSALEIPVLWQKPQVEQVGLALACWQKLGGFQDIISDELKQHDAYITGVRQAIVEALTLFPPTRWLEPEELIEEIQHKNVNFLFPERSNVENAGNRSYYSSRYGSAYFYGQPKTLLATFDRLEAEVVRACISGMLFQLGLVELGRFDNTPANAEQEWAVCRLTPLGAHLIKKQEPPASTEHTGKLLVQPNFQVMAIGPVSLATLARLDLFAVREQADRGAFQYRLSRESVYQAQQVGLSVAEVIKILVEEARQDSLPQNVQRSLEEWGSHHERIVFRQGVSLLQAANANLLNRLLTQPATANLLARPVAADVALVSPKKQAGLVEALRAQSLLPAVSQANPQAADRSILVQADGAIEPIHAVPSLHLRGRLAQLAEESDDGRWRLTATSVHRAGGSKRKVLQILGELEKLHRGQLPEPVVSMVKKWGGYYGRAAAQTVTLLEFSDREIMNELLESPRLKDMLTAFPTNDRALVIVAADYLEQVKTELSDLGVSVKEGLLSA